ncbi:UDP-glucose 4-epimerase GalE [Thiopseudomonas denitrificans]|uniref:UDP-glucose 4-epimerase n=1 Tax=Thiopseudomonas denitrificans TaxID=1501432 RepID=A0A4R6U338_9GAMM|nr:UDP-glucose 4-epimerase GalE [Thiopseudomonas denitrificans]TDQ37524.1 UDP-galactose 4-epimerase [Thiopseudomonas denitrificans]
MSGKYILVTGGAGYIGSHTCVELLEAGYRVLVLDNLSNSSPESMRRVQQITGKTLEFVEGDIRLLADLEAVFERFPVEAVVHFAGLKAVGESVAQPLRYYQNNVTGTLNLLQVMDAHNCRRLVFSSSATVYGDPASVPIREDFPLSATNPYGRSKLIIEDMLRDLCRADERWSVALLRYFNPVGAHVSGLIGEDPRDIPNNLMPYITQVAVGKRERLQVFGGDYPTPDGTGVRDYIHVVDLAKGHIKALAALDRPRLLTVNLGTGRGYSVLEMVAALEQASGCAVPYEIVARRPGDVAQCYADPALALELLGWQAELDLTRMCEDSWRWQSNNPQGYM